MYRECETCCQLKVPLKDHDPGLQVTWKKWTTRRVEKIKKGDNGEENISTVSMTVRQEESGSVLSLLQDFNENMSKICRHVYNIRHQYKTVRRLREYLKDNEVVIYMDFSENYNCKYDKEIQSVHFGASQIQVSLHTGVVYHENDVMFSFCTMSDHNKHGPAAIWALKPILNRVVQKNPKIDTVHFICDEPTSQYRCKQNFYLFCTLYLESGFKSGSWNFLEAGHGKGPADGIGGAIKRAADSFVSNGGSIVDAKSMYSALQKLKVELYLVDENDVKNVEKHIPSDLPAIQGTMKLHQVQTNRLRSLRVRILSCFCSDQPSSCFGVREFTFQGGLTVLESSDKHNEVEPCLDESKNLESGVLYAMMGCRTPVLYKM